MKAIQIDNYKKGNIEVMLRDVEKPIISDHKVLVKVHAAGINPIDVMIAHGDVKLITPYHFPLTLGNELAGEVINVGKDVTNFKPGDRVFARLPTNKIGAFAEFAAVPADALALIPDYLSFREAAAIPLAALTAAQALELLNLRQGDSLFISGGSGSFGAIAIPLAVAYGINVITNGGARNKERVLALGAKQYLDYRTEDYTKVLSAVDGVIDTLGGAETERQLSILKEGGTLVSLKGMPNSSFAKSFGLPKWKQWLFALASQKITRKAAKHGQVYHFLFVQANGKQLQQAADILSTRNYHPSLDGVFKLEETEKALEHVASGHSQGKTIIEI